MGRGEGDRGEDKKCQPLENDQNCLYCRTMETVTLLGDNRVQNVQKSLSRIRFLSRKGKRALMFWLQRTVTLEVAGTGELKGKEEAADMGRGAGKSCQASTRGWAAYFWKE